MYPPQGIEIGSRSQVTFTPYGIILRHERRTSNIEHRTSNVQRRMKNEYLISNIDGLVKSRKTPLSVIPAKAGIQFIQLVTKALDSGFHRSDDFLRVHQH